LKRVTVPTRNSGRNSSLTLKFPEKWHVQKCHMYGYKAPELTNRQIEAAIAKPIHSDTLSKLASRRSEAVILFDDITRPTQCSGIVPHVLAGLAKGGITDDHIRFIAALGAHAANNRVDFVNKIGEDAVRKYRVYNHNPFANLRDLGVTKRGTPVQINEEVMACDLKIGIGCIVPHSMAGFSGGGKIILPGVASVESICHNHCDIGEECFGRVSSTGFGPIENNASRADIDEASKMAGLDFKIDVIINEQGETSGVFAGDPYEEWRKGTEVGKRTYLTDFSAGADVVVANAYLKENQAVAAMNIAARAVRDGGTVVLLVNSPEGQNTHYLYGKFGKHLGGQLWARPPTHSRKMTIVVCSRYKERDPMLEIADPEHLVWTRTWSETIEAIAASTNVSRPRVVVFPAAGIQVPSSAYQ